MQNFRSSLLRDNEPLDRSEKLVVITGDEKSSRHPERHGVSLVNISQI